MRIFSWNVNGIKAAKKKGFEIFLKKKRIDILLVQEIKGSENDLPEIEGYNVFANPSKKKKGYAGTAVYSKEEPKSVKTGIGNSRFEKEGRSMTIEFSDFYIVNVYVPNSGQGLSRLDFRKDWDKAFLKYLKKLKKKKPVIAGGDFNVAHRQIDLARPKQNYNKTAGYTQDEIEGFENILNAGFNDTFRKKHPETKKYSYWSYRFNSRKKNIGWRIDYFLADENLMKDIEKVYILDDVKGSDHCPVGIKIKI